MSSRGVQRGRRRVAWITLIVALLVIAFCIAGYAMAAFFLAANAAPAPRQRSVMTVYLIGGACFLILAVGALVILVRDRASSPSPSKADA